MCKKLFLVLLFLLTGISLHAQTNIFNCVSTFVWNGSGACGVSYTSSNTTGFFITGQSGPTYVSGGNAILYGTSGGHNGFNLNYNTVEDIRSFSAVIQFTPGAENLSFIIQNNTSTNCCGSINNAFSAGAGMESSWFQGFGTEPATSNNIFALQLDWYAWLHYTDGAYTHSSAQIYQTWQSPLIPGDGASYFFPTDKVSTAPISFTSPTTTAGALTSDTYAAYIGYDGTTFTLSIIDVTAGTGTCTSSTSCTGTYFYHAWSNVNIPSLVGANTAYIGLSAGSSGGTEPQEIISTFSYTVNSPPSTPSLPSYTTSQTFTSGVNPPPTPTASPAAGTYSGAQSVTLSSAGSSYICYTVLSSLTSTTILPATDNYQGCSHGTLATGPITVSSSGTIYAVAGYSHSANTCAATSAACGGPPSAMSATAYTISGSSTPAATPTFSPVGGSYSTAQTIAISTTAGTVICYNTTGSPSTNGTTGCPAGSTLYSGPITVSSSEILYAVAGGTGYTDSSVGSATYTITSSSGTPSLIGGYTAIGGTSLLH